MHAHPTKKYSSKELLEKMYRYCAYRERCSEEVALKLKSLGADQKIIPSIIRKLTTEDYINDKRYAEVFARGKLLNNKWGRKKIEAALKLKEIPTAIIEGALHLLSEKDYANVLNELVSKRMKNYNNEIENIRKTKTFLFGKGFTGEEISLALKSYK